MPANHPASPGPHRPPRPSTDQPVYWFILLEDALNRRDFPAAAEARRQLRRLGVRVTYQRPRQGTGGGRVA